MRVNRSTVYYTITAIHLPSQTMIGPTVNACWFANRWTLERLPACRLVHLPTCWLVPLRPYVLVLIFCNSLGVWFPLLLLSTCGLPGLKLVRLRTGYPLSTHHWLCRISMSLESLMLGIFYVWNLPVPAASAAAALSALLRSGTSPAPIFHRWRPRPESNRWLINHMWRHPND